MPTKLVPLSHRISRTAINDKPRKCVDETVHLKGVGDLNVDSSAAGLGTCPRPACPSSSCGLRMINVVTLLLRGRIMGCLDSNGRSALFSRPPTRRHIQKRVEAVNGGGLLHVGFIRLGKQLPFFILAIA